MWRRRRRARRGTPAALGGEEAPRDHADRRPGRRREAAEVDDGVTAAAGRPAGSRAAGRRGTRPRGRPMPGPPATPPRRTRRRCRSVRRAPRSIGGLLVVLGERGAPASWSVATGPPAVSIRRSAATKPATAMAACSEVDRRRRRPRPGATGTPTIRTGSPRPGRPRERDRYGERQVRRKSRQPPALLGRLSHCPTDPREPHRQVGAESIDVVVGPGRFHRFDREIGPPRELRGEQPADELGAGLDLVGVHLSCGHEGASERARHALSTENYRRDAPRRGPVRCASTNTTTNRTTAIVT